VNNQAPVADEMDKAAHSTTFVGGQPKRRVAGVTPQGVSQHQKQISAIVELPLDTLSQNYSLPVIRAAMRLHANDPVGAVEALRPTMNYELAYPDGFNSLYPAYIRGLAYLQLGDGHKAAAEFQKLLDHPGLVGRHVIGALSYLQLGRAARIRGDVTAARKSYQEFLMLWKDADPDLSIYKEAKAEYAKL